MPVAPSPILCTTPATSPAGVHVVSRHRTATLFVLYTCILEAEKEPTSEGDVVLQIARGRNAIVRLT
jgi:hypothetical protein